MKLVVGLGNPGRDYQGTRHNVGFDVLACLAARLGVGKPKSRFQSELAEGVLDGERIVLLSPLTYMNLSGSAVRQAVDFYKVDLNDLSALIVVCDDLALDVGKIRLRAKGSAGGQKGLADVIRCLGSDQFARLRIGIGSPPASQSSADYVLRRFHKKELPEIELAVVTAADAVETWVREGVQVAMNRYNAGQPGESGKQRQSPRSKAKRDKVEDKAPIEVSPSQPNVDGGSVVHPN